MPAQATAADGFRTEDHRPTIRDAPGRGPTRLTIYPSESSTNGATDAALLFDWEPATLYNFLPL